MLRFLPLLAVALPLTANREPVHGMRLINYWMSQQQYTKA